MYGEYSDFPVDLWFFELREDKSATQELFCFSSVLVTVFANAKTEYSSLLVPLTERLCDGVGSTFPSCLVLPHSLTHSLTHTVYFRTVQNYIV